ncbi:MAG: cyclic nucleotide-binding domain-containing protein [Deltaproteobacteria bacterium]|nr:cyclic nucleotide-binding domain-containing protein [Deltaproteobacteria bacterium]
MGGIVGEIEFEFTEDGAGPGRFVPTGKVVGQILAHVAREETAAAARLYQGCSGEVAAELMRETAIASAKQRTGLLEMFVQARDFAAAARCAETIDDPRRAAELFESAYDFARAAALYRKAGEPARAALMYEKTMDFAAAGELYLEVGDLPRAAENLERGGDPLGAARLHLKTGNWKRAGAILHAVPSNRGEFFEAGTLLAEILWRTGHRELAIAKLLEVVRAYPNVPGTAELYYRLGEMFVETGKPEHGVTAFERVELLQPGFKDAHDRAAEARRLSHLPPAPVPSGDAAAPPDVPLDLGSPAAPATTPAGTLQLVDPDAEALRELPLFAELEHEELRELFQLCGRVTVPAGRTVLTRGEPGRGLFVVREGAVEVLGPAGAVLATLGPGQHFGEMSLLDEAPVSADVRARTAVVLLGIPREEFLRFLYLHERVARKVYRLFAIALARRLSETSARVAG